MNISVQRSEIEEVATVTDLPPRLAFIAPPAEDGGRYGETRRSRLPWIAAVALAHVAALYALTAFDIIVIKKKSEPIVIDLIQDQAPPPEVVLAPPPPPKDVPPPPDQQIPLIVSTAQTPVPAITVAPQPPAPSIVAPPAPPGPAPITPPDVDASTGDNPAPDYPLESRRKHEQGIVRVRVVITVDGRVKEVSIARSSGFERLDKAALAAVRRWHFHPGMQAGVAVEATGTLPVAFTLG